MIDAELLDTLELGDLLPEAMAAWRPLAVAGLAYFLERLPLQRQAAIVAAQWRLPPDADAATRLVALFVECPSLHKLGQALARHRGLPTELREALQRLESLPATLPAAMILAAIRREIDVPAEISIDEAILAEGSVAVVVPFRWTDAAGEQQGVFKLLKPGIEARLAEELEIFADLAGYLRQRGAELGLPQPDYADALDGVRRLLDHEVRLDLEQAHLRAAADFYAAEPRILVPRLLPWCTPRLTAMQRVFGVRITDARPGPAGAAMLAATLVETLLGQPFWSVATVPMHADLHAGNLMLTDDGRVAVLDWSLVARLGKAQREALTGVIVGALLLDVAAIAAALAALTGLPADDVRLVAGAGRALDRLVADAGLPAFDWLLGLLDDLALAGVGGFGEDLALMRKSWLSLRGAIGDLVGDPSPDAALLGMGLARLVTELPARALASPLSSDFSTHVANLDLWRLMLSPSLVACRWWSRRLSAG